MADEKAKEAAEAAKVKAAEAAEETTEETTEEVEAAEEKPANPAKKNNTKKYKKPIAVKYKPFSGKKNDAVVKDGKSYSGRGLVHFVSNGNSKHLGVDGKEWETPADRAQALVDKGFGKITGVVQDKKAKKKGH